MRKNQLKPPLLVSMLSYALVLSCTREKGHMDVTSPAYHIIQSERVIIPPTIELPQNLPNGNSRVATFYAIGVQKYKAQVITGSNPVAYQWVFVAPDADLYDVTNSKVGTYSIGPTWQLSPADSMFGQNFIPPRTAPSPDPESIDWLLLMLQAGKIATGVFANVSYVQCIDTRSGKPPDTPPIRADQTINVGYTAIYRFSMKNP
jgi:Protein of unknown function (DUF3455)